MSNVLRASSPIIQQMKFSGYFLIVWDFIRHAKDKASLLARGEAPPQERWSHTRLELRISTHCSMSCCLTFSNPERISMPDIDIDFCMNRRGEVIEYVTMNMAVTTCADHHLWNLAAKAAIKDVGRAMDMPYSDVHPSRKWC